MPLAGLVRPWWSAPARSECDWPDQELDRPVFTAPGVSRHSPAVTPPGPDPSSAPEPGRNAMSSLSEIVEVVIGVDTHVETHTAAVVDARTGAVLDELTVPTTPEGYQDLVDLADAHTSLRAWAIEGTGGHGAGLARHLSRGEEVVLELDRPERPRR